MAEERFLLAQPLLPFLPQQRRRKQSLESVVVPGSGTRLVPGPAAPFPASGLTPGCCWGHPICAGPLEQLSCPHPLQPLELVVSQSDQPRLFEQQVP